MIEQLGKIEKIITNSLNSINDSKRELENLEFEISDIENRLKKFDNVQTINVNQIDQNELIREEISNIKTKIEKNTTEIKNAKEKIYNSLADYHNLKINIKFGSEIDTVIVEEGEINEDGTQEFRIKLNEDYL